MHLLIIGGGLAGACLAKRCLDANLSFLWYADQQASASHISSGILNPVTGRRYALSWKYEELLAEAIPFYGKYLKPIRLEKHFKSYKNEETIQDVVRGKEYYLSAIDKEWILVKSSYQLDTRKFIAEVMHYASQLSHLRLEKFEYDVLENEDRIWKYKGEEFSHILFAEGIFVKENPFFNSLPFQPNRGEALLIDIATDKPTSVKKHGKFICPFEDKFWIGSSFDKVDRHDPLRTDSTRLELLDALPNLIGNVDYSIAEHFGALRSTTPSRRPIVGEHPSKEGLFILNGLGTKGASLAPYCSRQLMNHILNKEHLDTEIDIARYWKE